MDKKFRWLVTGGAGFIGSHITQRLLKEGHYVRVLDDFSSGKEENLSFVIASAKKGEASGETPRRTQAKNFELIRGDIRDYATCLRACDAIDFVLHQAALRSVPQSLDRPHDYNAVNIDGTVNMLKAALEKNTGRFVFASSSSVYGEARSFPQKETDPSFLISPYALTKLAGEYYCRIFSINYGLETAALRYFNVFGPRQSLDDEYAVVIPKFITSMLNDERPPAHGDGRQSRDFTYVDNVVEANILAATTPGILCEVFNVGLGRDKSILELIDTLNNIMGKDIPARFTPTRPGDVRRSLADITKIKELLDFEPVVSFEEGLRKTTHWFANARLMARSEASPTGTGQASSPTGRQSQRQQRHETYGSRKALGQL